MMSKPQRMILSVLLTALMSVVLLQNNSLNALKSAQAAESPSVETANTVLQKQLHQLLLERKTIFDSFVVTSKVALEYGRGTKRDYLLAKKAALLAGLDLCKTKEERIEIRREVLRFYDIVDQSQMQAEAGLIGPDALSEARLERLELEIDLLREQLK